MAERLDPVTNVGDTYFLGDTQLHLLNPDWIHANEIRIPDSAGPTSGHQVLWFDRNDYNIYLWEAREVTPGARYQIIFRGGAGSCDQYKTGSTFKPIPKDISFVIAVDQSDGRWNAIAFVTPESVS